MSRNVRVANESITSNAVTSTITPRERNRMTLVDQRPAQLQKVRIRKRSLDGGDEKAPLFENWDFHRPPYDWVVSATGTTL